MGIGVEFNPDLALRDVSEHKKGNRKIEECIPENMETGKVYDFLKNGQRNYWLHGEIPLIETKGSEKLSRPRASIHILEATHFLDGKEIWTKGKFKVIEVFTDGEIKFEGLWRTGVLDF
jgi:hypothetical protein